MKEFEKLTSRYDIYKVLLQRDVKRICEVGVDHGWNLTNLCKCKPELAVAIDVWDICEYYNFYSLEFHERNYKEILRRVLEENRCILPIRLDSLKAVNIFPNNYFHFIYIDASHDYISVKANIEAYWQKVIPGYYMAGHDYHSGERAIAAQKLRLKGDDIVLNFGVKDAVDEFVVNNSLRLAIIHDESGIDTWVIEKPNG